MVALMCDEPDENACVRLMGINDYSAAKRVHYRVSDVTADRVVSEADVLLPADSSIEIGLLDTNGRTAFYEMEWTVDGRSCRNHYVTWAVPFNKEAYIKYAQKAGIIK